MFIIKSYDDMKAQFSIKIEEVLLRAHRVKTVEELPEPRRGQVQFINRFIKQLDEYKPEKMEKVDHVLALKAKILTGCLYVMYDLIKLSYEKSVLNTLFKVSDPTSSGLFTILPEVMGMNMTNVLDLNTKRSMMEQTERFFCSQLCLDANLTREIKLDHPFVSVVYLSPSTTGFNLAEFVNHTIEIREMAGKDSWREKFSLDKAQQQARMPVSEPSKSSLLSMFNSKSTVKSSSEATGVTPQTVSAKKEDFPPLSTYPTRTS